MRLSFKGFILITTLILMLIVSCISLSVLVQTQLSQKLSGSATLAFQLRHQTQTQHSQQLQRLKQGSAEVTDINVAPCPASYAAWTDFAVRCEWHQLQTRESLAHQHHRMTSVVVRQTLPEGGEDGLL